MRDFNENDLIDSPLSQRYERNGKSVSIEIYRLPGTRWSLEVVDEHGNSTVWNEDFETDEAAHSAALNEIELEGIDSFIGPPQVD